MNFLLAIIFGAMGGLLAANGFWPYARADAEGIRWRNWRGNHQARWDEIQDFYEVLPKTSAGRSQIVLGGEVITRDGAKLFIPLDWADRDRLRATIVERAVNATAARQTDGTAGWLPKGARTADFPMAFTYDAEAVRKERRIASAWTAFCVLVCGIPAALIVGILAFLGLSKYPMLLLGFLGIVLCPLLIFLGLVLRRWGRSQQARRDALARAARQERFEAGVGGLTVHDSGEARTVPWDTIVGYDYVLPTAGNPALSVAPVCRIRTADGREFTLTNRLSDFPLFQNLLRRWAPEAVEARQESEAKEALGGVSARWTGGEEGNGDRVYHCRTRALRYRMLLFGALGFVGLATLLVAILDTMTGHRPITENPYRWFQSVAYLVFLALAVVSALQFWTEKVVLHRNGIVRRFASQEAFIPWAEVAEVREEGATLTVQSADGTKISFIPSQYAYGSEIKERIAEYRRPFVHRVTQADVADAPLTMTVPPTPRNDDIVQIVQR